jgi:hypothetical protein
MHLKPVTVVDNISPTDFKSNFFYTKTPEAADKELALVNN